MAFGFQGGAYKPFRQKERSERGRNVPVHWCTKHTALSKEEGLKKRTHNDQYERHTALNSARKGNRADMQQSHTHIPWHTHEILFKLKYKKKISTSLCNINTYPNIHIPESTLNIGLILNKQFHTWAGPVHIYKCTKIPLILPPGPCNRSLKASGTAQETRMWCGGSHSSTLNL